jgi:hypothetical protein
MTATGQLIACPKCKAVLGSEFFNQPWLPCPSCQSQVRVEVFPSLFREVTSTTAPRVMIEGEASCFYHAEKKAAVVCDGCGRFLCTLCDVEFDAQHLCPSCLQSGQEKGKLAKLQNSRTRHDKIALVLAFLPLVLFFTVYLTIITAPIALFCAIRYWNAPTTITPNWRRFNMTVALIVSILEIGGWITFFVWLGVK